MELDEVRVEPSQLEDLDLILDLRQAGRRRGGGGRKAGRGRREVGQGK